MPRNFALTTLTMKACIRLLVSVAIAGAVAAPSVARAAEINVLSDSPLGPALTKIAESFQRESGHTVKFVLGLSPVIHKKVLDGEPADVVIVQPNFIDELVKAGKLAPGDHPIVARVGIGLFTRAGAAAPDISSVSALKQALLGADTIALSNVATGNYFVTVLDRLDIADAVKNKVTRSTPAEVVSRIVQGQGKDIGAGTITLILVDKRLKLIGPLPGELQSYLVYAAALATSSAAADASRAFIRYLGSPDARAAFTATGAN